MFEIPIVVIIDVLLIVHVIKTGRFMPWFYVIIFLPGFGALIYVVMEILPELTGSRGARKARSQIATALNPSGRYRQLADELAIVDTISNRAALAEECLRIGKFEEAKAQYSTIIAAPLGDEPNFMLGKARAEFGLGQMADAVTTLDELKRRWPDYSSFDGHLLYARALEGAGRDEEALQNYEGVARYFPGSEPRVRQAQLLKRLGREAEAKEIAEDVVRSLRRAPAHVRQNQKQWLASAQKLASS